MCGLPLTRADSPRVCSKLKVFELFANFPAETRGDRAAAVVDS